MENGYDIDVKFVEEKCKVSGVLYKQHIMQALVEKDYTTSIYSDLYRRLFKNNGICARDIKEYDGILDVAFENAKQREKCRKEAGDDWDEEEFYPVAAQYRRCFPGLVFEQISFCAGVITISGKR